MALIKCKECGKDISDQATTCPNCGAKTDIAIHKKKNIVLTLIAILFIAIILTSIYFVKSNDPLYKYGHKAINLLNDYKNYKIETIDLVEKLEQISDDIRNESNKEQDTLKSSSMSTLSVTLYSDASKISRNYYWFSQNNRTSDTQIDEYIKEIKDILK